MGGLLNAVQRLVHGIEEQDKITNELAIYRKAEGIFGMEIAIRQRNTKSPAEWWSSFGSSTPNLQRFAIRVLSLTCSASGCERNWSAFEQIHSKKRNRLAQQRLNDLVFVKYNRALIRRFNARNTIDPISLSDIDDSNEWLMGRMDGESDGDNDLVYDDDNLTWGEISKAAGVDEVAYNTRSIRGKSSMPCEANRGENESGSSSRTNARPRPRISSAMELIDEEEDDLQETENEEEDIEKDISDGDDLEFEFEDEEDVEF